MPTKDRMLVLLQTLQQCSDDETYLTTGDLRAVLEAEGHECSIRTLRRDMKALNACGYEIDVKETEGMPTKYAYLSRDLEKPELQILVDAVSAAQFIPQKRSEDLIRKLSKMAGPSHEKELVPQILVSEHVKAKNKNMIYSVQAIRQAIDRDRKIRFRYLRYNDGKQQVPRQEDGKDKQYIISPYATVWNDDRYYLVGWSDQREKVTVFRIDRMEVPKQLSNKRVPPPEDFDIRDYTDKVFRMYGGEEEEVTLRFSEEILDQVIDRFGDRIELKKEKAKKATKKANQQSAQPVSQQTTQNPTQQATYTITVPVSLSTTFYAWIFQYVGKMRITAPEYVREEYANYLRQALDESGEK